MIFRVEINIVTDNLFVESLRSVGRRPRYFKRVGQTVLVGFPLHWFGCRLG